MSNEIQVATSVSITNGSLSAGTSSNWSADQAAAGSIQRKATISTGGSTLDLSGVTTPRAIHITNVDPDNYVDVGPDSTGLVGLIRLLAGESCFFPLKPGVTVKAIAHTANVPIEFFVGNA